MKKIVFVAGDKSGDFYAGTLSKLLKERYREAIDIYSFGGDTLARHSQQIINLVAHSVSGIFEALTHIGELLGIFNQTVRSIREINPDILILVDFPDFNLRLAKKLWPQFKIFYYVSPQIWAWRKKRIKSIKKYIENIIVLFEFEKEMYAQEGIQALYFGHPLLDILKDHRQDTPEKLIIFLPGSRKNEVKAHLPIMCKAKRLIQKQLPDYKFLIIKPENIPLTFYTSIIQDEIPVARHSYEQLLKAKFIVTSSGTATLELAIMEIPHLVMYKVNLLSWLLLKNMVTVDFTAMPNIVAGKKIVEEYIQYNATAQNIADYTLSIIKNNAACAQLKHALQAIKKKLEPYRAPQETATFIGNYLELL